MSFGESLMSIRKGKGISRKDFAEQLNIPYTTLRNYETDQREPGHKLLIKMATLLQVSVDELIGYQPQNKKVLNTTEAALGTELEREVIRLAGNLSDEQKDFFLALIRLTAARNQGLSAADLVSAGEAALKAEHHNPTQ